jgi:hypothetical protein
MGKKESVEDGSLENSLQPWKKNLLQTTADNCVKEFLMSEEKEEEKDFIEELQIETDETKTPEEPESSPKQEYNLVLTENTTSTIVLTENTTGTLVLTENTDNRDDQGFEPDWGDVESLSSGESVIAVDGFDLDVLCDAVEKARMLEEYKKNKFKGFLISDEKRQEGWFLDKNGTLERLSARDRKHGWLVNEFLFQSPQIQRTRVLIS